MTVEVESRLTTPLPPLEINVSTWTCELVKHRPVEKKDAPEG